MRILVYLLSVFLVCMSSCEELIHVDLNTGDPRYVIEADLDNISSTQTIRVSQTVAFNADKASEPIDDAQVEVKSSGGQRYVFYPMGDGYYQNANFTPKPNSTYYLSVKIDDEVFTATEVMQPFINVDSIGSLEETIFNETNYSVLVKFSDPLGQADYYKYLVSINQQPFRFFQAYSDKYNDGLYVTHQLTDFTKPFALGDSILVRRQIITKPVFDYWNQIQMLNPGSAAPANPKSNISNGAFGYFSVSNSKDYGITIRSYDQLKLRE
ncbi:DUF4249 domain-containing protein [Parapedobacter sp. SGR-10]|uniref:DUF4249 domain-containing protein n=1 Tax=Parapedobacter sp. SGR-10 TaxID=2710879 RepID=UPI0013D6E08F|nr:DUF4249 domain-containing protein [Parapedobacter sp. SGR-10]NGF56676.1 DUF4249 domain-containing protein [Parapedobacter sp. SGR-10]